MNLHDILNDIYVCLEKVLKVYGEKNVLFFYFLKIVKK